MLEPEDISTESSILVLLQAEKFAVDQMQEIKRDEMSWLKVFLVFYGAVITWLVTEWIPGSNELSDSSIEVIRLIQNVTLAATFLFAYLFATTRDSYYGVRKRVEKVQDMLFLNREGIHGEHAVYQTKKVEDIRSPSDWWNVTKPQSSFLTRMVYLLGGYWAVTVIALLALRGNNEAADNWIAILYGLVGLLIFVFFLFLDYLRYVKKT